jgi:nicotinate-nucleotide pyrophosphorylase (carboxylating)
MLTLQIQTLIEAALNEDLAQGDVTTDGLPELAVERKGYIVTRQPCVVSGLDVAEGVIRHLDPAIRFEPKVAAGEAVEAMTVLADIEGPWNRILEAERTVLNFLQHLCGIATETRKFVDAIQGTKARIAGTRKTTPGLRLLEKQAVVDGGALPHRFNLGSAIMLKDNHIGALGGLKNALNRLRATASHTTTIEVEVETLAMVEQVLAIGGVDIIMLDNMTPETVAKAVEIVRKANGGSPRGVITEASGGISLQTVRAYAETGVDVISTSQITLGAPAVDIGLDIAECALF